MLLKMVLFHPDSRIGPDPNPAGPEKQSIRFHILPEILANNAA